MSVKNKIKNFVSRFDSFTEVFSGRGTDADKVNRIKPGVKIRLMPQDAKYYYYGNGLLQSLIKIPAEDATREFINIETNLDETKNINRLIEKRLQELKVRQKLKELVKLSRTYNEGAVLYFGFIADLPQYEDILKDEIDIKQIRKLDFINIVKPPYFSYVLSNNNPLKKKYDEPSAFYIQGQEIDESRLEWLCMDFDAEEQAGISTLYSLIDSIKAQDTALWSVNSLMFELAIKVFKSPLVKEMNPEKIAEFITKMKATVNTQSAIAVSDDEDFNKKNFQASGLKEAFDFIWECMAGVSQIPKSRIMGNNQGVITAGQYDILSYYESVSKYQELYLRPILQRIIDIIIYEKEGDIYKATRGQSEKLDYSFTFNPLWRLGPKEQAEVDKLNAETDNIYYDIGVKSPEMILQDRFEYLQDFHIE
jgi:phage-related protein (TIGR01555 family)